MVYSNGEQYTGSWVNGKAIGYGTYKFITGAVYKGNWNEGKKEGVGT